MNKHNIPLFKDSALFYTLVYRVRIAQHLPNLQFRLSMVKTTIIALHLYGTVLT